MRFHNLILLALLLASSLNACAQSIASERVQVAPVEVGLNYNFVHANAPPSQCGCFSLNGGSGTLVVNAAHGLSFVVDLSSSHASHIDATTQNVTLFNALGGVRYSYRTPHRITPYIEALAGDSNEFSNYAYVQRANAFAASGGIGINMVVKRHIGITLLEADYLYSRLPNAGNNQQNDLQIVSGILFRFGPR